MSETEKKEVSRRSFVQSAAAGIVGLAVGAGIGYGASSMAPSRPAPTVTVTTTAAATPSKPSVEEIRVGCIEPLTGSGASSGQDIQRVANFYIDEYNASGGIRTGPFKGAKIKLVWADGQSQPDIARTEAERLVSSGNVSLMVGSMWTALTIPMRAVCEKAGFPLLNNAAGGITVTKTAGNKWLWRTGPHDEFYGQVIAKFLKEVQEKSGTKLKSMGIIYNADKVGQDFRDYFVNVLNRDPQLGGYDVAFDIPITPGVASVDSEVLTIKKANPDFLIQNVHVAEGTLLFKAIRQYEVDLKAHISNSTELYDKRFQETVGKLTDGLILRSTWNYDVEKPMSKELDGKFMAKYGYHIPDARYLLAMQIVAKLFERVRESSLEPKVIQQTFNEMYVSAEDVITPWGVKFFPPGHVDAGQNMLAGGILLQYFGQSDVSTIYPWDVAAKKVVFPLQTWKQRGL